MPIGCVDLNCVHRGIAEQRAWPLRCTQNQIGRDRQDQPPARLADNIDAQNGRIVSNEQLFSICRTNIERSQRRSE